MKEKYTGPGCMASVGYLFFLAALYFIVAAFLGGGGEVIPWIIACVAAGLFILSVSDARQRISRIEKHLGLDDPTEEEDQEEDSNSSMHGTSQ